MMSEWRVIAIKPDGKVVVFEGRYSRRVADDLRNLLLYYKDFPAVFVEPRINWNALSRRTAAMESAEALLAFDAAPSEGSQTGTALVECRPDPNAGRVTLSCVPA